MDVGICMYYVNPTNFVFEVDTVLFCNDTAFIGMQ